MNLQLWTFNLKTRHTLYKMSCTCNQNQTKTIICFRKECNQTWKTVIPHYEKVATCPEHYSTIALCGGGYPRLCHVCKIEGYSVERINGNVFPPKYHVVVR